MGICVAKDIDEADRLAALDNVSLEGGEESYQAPPSYYSDRQETRCGPTPGSGPNDVTMGAPLSLNPGEHQSLFIRRETDEEVLSAHQMLREIDRLRELVQNMNDDGIGLRDLVDSEDMYLGDTSAKKSDVRKSLSRRSHNSTLEESSVRGSSSRFQANASIRSEPGRARSSVRSSARSSASESPFNSSLPPSQVVTPNQSPRKRPKRNSSKKAEVNTTRKVVKRDTSDSRRKRDLGFRNKDKKWKPYKPDKHTREASDSHWLAPRIPKLKEPEKVPRKLGPRDIGRNKSTPKPPRKNLKINTESSVEISRSYSDQTLSSGNIGSPKRGTKLLNKSKKKKKRQILEKLKEDSQPGAPRKVRRKSSRKTKENVNIPPPPTIVIESRKKETKTKRLKLKQSGPPRKKKKIEKELETPPKKLATLTKKKIDLPKKIKKIQLPSKLRNSQKKLPPEDSTPKPRALQRMSAVPTVTRESSDPALEPTTNDDAVQVQTGEEPSRKKSLSRRSMEILEKLEEVPNDDNFDFDLAQFEENLRMNWGVSPIGPAYE